MTETTPSGPTRHNQKRQPLRVSRGALAGIVAGSAVLGAAFKVGYDQKQSANKAQSAEQAEQAAPFNALVTNLEAVKRGEPIPALNESVGITSRSNDTSAEVVPLVFTVGKNTFFAYFDSQEPDLRTVSADEAAASMTINPVINTEGIDSELMSVELNKNGLLFPVNGENGAGIPVGEPNITQNVS